MGKVILCAGKKADSPYLVRGTGIRVATIEELCFCLKHNLDMIDASTIERDTAIFIRDELGLTESGNELEQLIMNSAELKERVVAIMKSCDLYNEEEIEGICSEIDMISAMSNLEIRKRRADRYMRENNYAEASKAYRSIIVEMESGNELSLQLLGDIRHNLAVIEINQGEIDEAISLFREAYNANERESSLKSYLMALKLSKDTAKYRSEVQRLVTNVQIFNEIENAVNAAEEDFEQSPAYTEISRLKVLWQQGIHSEAKRLSEEMIAGFKASYRQNQY